MFDLLLLNGILLFWEISKLIVVYGLWILVLLILLDLYMYKYKGIWVVLMILIWVLVGNYVNFGVFELYGD